jgi:hypothetical protein
MNFCSTHESILIYTKKLLGSPVNANLLKRHVRILRLGFAVSAGPINDFKKRPIIVIVG